MQTHYDILGLSQSATPAEIKAAFRRLAKLYHPDKNPQGKEQFEKVLVAYEVLIDYNRRRQYDLRIKHGTGGSSQTASKNQARKQWSYTEEELRRRQYYQENYKSHYQKTKTAAPHPPLKKNYNEYKYILFATPIAVALLMFIITIYDKENFTVKPSKPAFPQEKKEVKVPESPYTLYFKNPVYDTAAKLNVLVNNLSPQEAVVLLFDQRGKFLRSAYIKQDYFAEVGQLPKEKIQVKVMLGNEWNGLKEFKEAEVVGGFEKVTGYWETEADQHNRWTITIDRNGISSFKKISEKEYFKKTS